MSVWSQPVLDVVVQDHRPIARDTREAMRVAIHAAAAERRGLVHISAVRRHLPSWIEPAQVGAFISALTRRGYLIPTGRYEPNGDIASGNASKPAAVRRLTRPIPPEEAS